jgi:UDP-N-acetylglucosamine 2-epimerase (non-hydrolysing)/GDP/UDP-N,N'-diacetylbacillosamine 2-epimerase (hydrolysing)
MPRDLHVKNLLKSGPPGPDRSGRRRVCFVTGTRAEFGLMRAALNTIRSHPHLALQLIATGMHLDPRHGESLRDITDDGFRPDAIVPWQPSTSGATPTLTATNTGRAISALAEAYERLETDVVLVVGDRVEALAAAVAAHLSHRCLAHVHGGDRALGQIDDSLRHAITKLAHVHFPATRQSASRILRLGEDKWRIHQIGSPGLDGIHDAATPPDQLIQFFPSLTANRFALVALHPVDPDEELEHCRAKLLLDSLRETPFDQTIIIYPNNDPGSAGIIRCWESHEKTDRVRFFRNLPRAQFLAVMRDAAVLVGNSSSGIIEAASFGTPVLDIGPRQQGRERSRNVLHCDYDPAAISRILKKLWNLGKPKRIRCRNIYGSGDASRRMADILARTPLDPDKLRKLIRY